jgi:iron complex outermembrane receptor protein
MQNLQVGYSFDADKLGKHINRLRLSLTGNNLFIITDYSGFDPEVDTNKEINGVNSAGIDYFSYPRSKGFVFGVTIGF